jgi:putative phosphoribosyl transferase
MLFRNRTDAGRQLAKRLLPYRDRRPVVLALAEGGVPVGREVAEALSAPLDVVLVRKIGAPFQPEIAVAAIAGGDKPELVINGNVKAALHVPDSYIASECAIQFAAVERLRPAYRNGRPNVAIEGRTVIIVDDGIRTGATARAAIKATRRRSPAAIILAVPVAPLRVLEALRPECDEAICLWTPVHSGGASRFYRGFTFAWPVPPDRQPAQMPA